MTPTPTPSAALDADLALLERFIAASDLLAQALAVAVGATVVIVLIALSRLALGWRPRSHRATLAIVGSMLGTWLIAVPAGNQMYRDTAPATVQKTELCDRLFARLAAHDADTGTIDRVLAACPDHTGALRGVLTAERR